MAPCISWLDTTAFRQPVSGTFGLIPKLQQALKSVRNLAYIGPGLGILGVARNPNGWTSELSAVGDLVRRVLYRGHPPTGAGDDGAIDLRSGGPTQSPEEVRELAGTAS